MDTVMHCCVIHVRANAYSGCAMSEILLSLFYWGACLPYCLDWGPKKHSAYQSACPDSESVTQFGTRTPIRTRKFTFTCTRLWLCVILQSNAYSTFCIVIMYAFPQGYPFNWSLTFNLELYTSICEAD